MPDAPTPKSRKKKPYHSGKTRVQPRREPRPNGRPSGYRPFYAEEARALFSQGFTDQEVADYFGVEYHRINIWAKQYPEFRSAIKIGKEATDDRVERTMYQRAVGFRYRAQKVMVVDKKVEVVEYMEQVLPDTTACIFWLKNRRPDLWRDVHKMEHSRTSEYAKLSDADLARALLEEAEAIAAVRDLAKTGETEQSSQALSASRKNSETLN